MLGFPVHPSWALFTEGQISGENANLCWGDDIHAHEVDTIDYDFFILIYKFLFQLDYKAA